MTTLSKDAVFYWRDWKTGRFYTDYSYKPGARLVAPENVEQLKAEGKNVVVVEFNVEHKYRSRQVQK